MPTVNTQHRTYVKMVPRWSMIRDAVEGEHQVKSKGDQYLPKLLKQTETEYEAYKLRALFFEAARRTLQGLVGMVMRKDPTIEASNSTKEGLLKNVTKSNLGINGLANVVMQEVLMMNKYGLLADLPPVISTGSEPWLVGYNAESMINWDFNADAEGKKILTRMVLEEEYNEVDPEDRFKVSTKKQWRVLELVNKNTAIANIDADPNAPRVAFAPNQRNVYRVQVWRKKDDQKGLEGQGASPDEFSLHTETFPALRGAAMDRIPFVIVTSDNEDASEQKPPMEGLASVNMSHYRSSADLEHGRHFVGLPTPYIIGVSGEQKELTIGSAKAWMISNVSAQDVEVGLLEFTGKGLEALEKALTEKQQQMAILGARLLEEQKKAAEAFETHELRAAGEHSVLSQVANGVSEGLNAALAILTTWDTSLGKIVLTLNTEFVRVGLSPQMLQQLLLALQAGRISFTTYFHKMQEGGMYPDEHTEEKELKAIQADLSTLDQEVDDLEEEDDDDDEDEDDLDES